MLGYDGSVINNTGWMVQTYPAEGSINLSSLQVAREPDVFDRIFALAFDTLHLHTLIIRVQEHCLDDSSTSAV